MRTRIPKGNPTQDALSVALGFRVPEAFVKFANALYELSGNGVRGWPELFADITGAYVAGAEIRYPQTPPELFPFAAAGVDGIHYGYVIHAPELLAEDYPVGDLSPSEESGVELVGSNTFEAIENLVSSQFENVGEEERVTIARVSRQLGIEPTVAKAQRL